VPAPKKDCDFVVIQTALAVRMPAFAVCATVFGLDAGIRQASPLRATRNKGLSVRWAEITRAYPERTS
jgi:hypothetical protein